MLEFSFPGSTQKTKPVHFLGFIQSHFCLPVIGKDMINLLLLTQRQAMNPINKLSESNLVCQSIHTM